MYVTCKILGKITPILKNSSGELANQDSRMSIMHEKIHVIFGS